LVEGGFISGDKLEEYEITDPTFKTILYATIAIEEVEMNVE
jgi:hypothetical protein